MALVSCHTRPDCDLARRAAHVRAGDITIEAPTVSRGDAPEEIACVIGSDIDGGIRDWLVERSAVERC